MRRQPTEYVNYVFDKGHVPRICKELSKRITEKTTQFKAGRGETCSTLTLSLVSLLGNKVTAILTPI